MLHLLRQSQEMTILDFLVPFLLLRKLDMLHLLPRYLEVRVVVFLVNFLLLQEFEGGVQGTAAPSHPEACSDGGYEFEQIPGMMDN